MEAKLTVMERTGFSADYWRSLWENRNNPMERRQNPFDIPHSPSEQVRAATSSEVRASLIGRRGMVDPEAIRNLRGMTNTPYIAPDIAVAPGANITGVPESGVLQSIKDNPVLYGSLLLGVLILVGLRYKY